MNAIPKRPGISETTIVAAGIRYGDYPEPGSIVIPYWTSDAEMTKFNRYRLPGDRADGQKYHQEPGSGVYAYYPPGFFRHNGADSRFGLAADSVILVEGEFKALSLLELGIYAIGLPNFNVYVKDENEHRRLLRDLQVTFAREKIRAIYFLGDADTCTNFEFSRQAAFLARNAWQSQVFLPRIPIDQKKGIDDCKAALREGFDAFFIQLIKEAIPLNKKLDETEVAFLLFDQGHKALTVLAEVDRQLQFMRIVRMVGAAQRFGETEATARLRKLAAKVIGISEAALKKAIKTEQEKGTEKTKTKQPSAPSPDPRPIVWHPNDDTYISDFARELGHVLKNYSFHRFHGRAVHIRSITLKGRSGVEHEVKKLVELPVALFSTIIETYCRPMVRTHDGYRCESISLELAGRTLVCLDFVDDLPEIKFWTCVRTPSRNKNKITLSPRGYDPKSAIYTAEDAPEIDETMTVDEAIKAWRKLMSEFCFPKSGISEAEEPDERKREPERERCISVALAAALTPYCLLLLPEKAKRPAFIVSANAEGAGKTLLLSFGMVAELGFVPTGTAPFDENEMRKVLDSAVHFAVPILFFDNLKGHLSSGELEAFITSATRRYRMLGTTNYFEEENISTIYITANFPTYSGDLRRRSLVIELILEEARAEERKIKNFLDENKLIEMRPRLLSIFWALIKDWDKKGQKPSSTLLPSFEEWSRVVGGIVENAGFSSPCQSATLQTGGDTDTQDMERLVEEMVNLTEYRFSDLVDLARDNHLFERLIPAEGDLEAKQRTRLARIIRKFVGRTFWKIRFVFCLSKGTPKTERYYKRGIKNSGTDGTDRTDI